MSTTHHPKFIEAMEQLCQLRDDGSEDHAFLETDEGQRLMSQAIAYAPPELKRQFEESFLRTFGREMPKPTIMTANGELGYTVADVARFTGETVDEVMRRAEFMADVVPEGYFQSDNTRHVIRALVYIEQEDSLFVAICPLFDVASQGDTEKEALANVTEAIQLFIETCADMGTLHQVMAEAGIGVLLNHQPPVHAPKSCMIHVPISQEHYAQACAY